jgi:hypothetical protein
MSVVAPLGHIILIDYNDFKRISGAIVNMLASSAVGCEFEIGI